MEKNKPHILVQNQYFLNESSLEEYIAWGALPRISFVGCHFENVDLMGLVFGSCRFQNCTFNHFNARKGKFSACYLEDCKMTNSDMTRTEFYDTYLKNCEFLGVDLAASDFDKCKFKGTRFLKCNLYVILIDDVKIWNSKEWVDINDFSSFEKYLDE